MKIKSTFFFVIVICGVLGCQSNTEQIYNTADFNERPVQIQEINYTGIDIPTEANFLNPNLKIINEELDAVIIYDDLNTSIYRFDLEGNYILSLGGEGEAPFEYSEVSDIRLDSDNKLYVYSTEDKKFNTYHLNGKFLKYKKLNFYGKTFEVLNKNFVFNTGYNFSDVSGRNVLLQYDQNFNLVSQEFKTPIEPRAMIGISGFFAYDSKYNRSYFSHGMSDTIHVMDRYLNEEFKVVVSDVENVWPHGFNYIKILEDPNALEYSWIGDKVKIANGNLFLKIHNKRVVSTTVFDFKQKKKFKFENDLIYFLSDYLVSGNSDEGIYYCLFTDETLSRVMESDLEEMVDEAKYPKLFQLLNSNKLNERPFIYRFKMI